MRRLAALADALEAVDAAAGGAAVQQALQRAFDGVPAADAAWLVALALGRGPGRRLSDARLRRAACAAAGIDDAMFEACRRSGAGFAETVALVVPPSPDRADPALAEWIERQVLALPRPGAADDDGAAAPWIGPFTRLGPRERELHVQLLRGRGIAGVPQADLQQVLAQRAGIEPWRIALRLGALAGCTPNAVFFEKLISGVVDAAEDAALPRTWADEREGPPAVSERVAAPEPADWLVLRSAQGERAQLVRHVGGCSLWVGEEDLAARAQAVVRAAEGWPAGTVVEGAVIRAAARAGAAGALGPVVAFEVDDLADLPGVDVAGLTAEARRARLERLPLELPVLRLAPRVQAAGWGALARRFDGLRGDIDDVLVADDCAVAGHAGAAGEPAVGAAACGAGGGLRLAPRAEAGHVRRWWVWRARPRSVHAVVLQVRPAAEGPAQCTLALWSRPPCGVEEVDAVVRAIERRDPPRPGALRLVPVARLDVAAGGALAETLAHAVAVHAVERFGPVRGLRPALVVELAFDAVEPAPRRLAGVALRGARIVAAVPGLGPLQAGSLEALAPRAPACASG